MCTKTNIIRHSIKSPSQARVKHYTENKAKNHSFHNFHTNYINKKCSRQHPESFVHQNKYVTRHNIRPPSQAHETCAQCYLRTSLSKISVDTIFVYKTVRTQHYSLLYADIICGTTLNECRRGTTCMQSPSHHIQDATSHSNQQSSFIAAAALSSYNNKQLQVLDDSSYKTFTKFSFVNNINKTKFTLCR